MAQYVMNFCFSEKAIKALAATPQDREVAARQVVESFGGRLIGYWFMLGEHDGLLIAEFPDNVSAAAVSMTVGATGSFARFETHALLTAAEAEQAMRKAKGAGGSYRSPLG